LVDVVSYEKEKVKVTGLDVIFLLNEKGVPCIATSAYGDNKTIQDVLLRKAKDIWFKTEKIIVLKEKIEAVLKREQ